MKYKVHRFEINMTQDQDRLEQFLNNLEGEVVSIIPNAAKTTIFQIYGDNRQKIPLVHLNKIFVGCLNNSTSFNRNS